MPFSLGRRSNGGDGVGSPSGPRLPQAHHDQQQQEQQQQPPLEYDGLIGQQQQQHQNQPNCCTWKVATLFLFIVAASLVSAWVVLPAEDIVAKYIPKFDAPTSPYVGPEAGIPGENDGSSNSQIGGATNLDDSGIGTVVPTFMQCPTNNNNKQCCNGSTTNCALRVDQMMFALVHNAMSSEEKGFIVGYNHQLSISKALMAGYRGLSLDVCNCNGVLQFCHNVCGEYFMMLCY
jgi:hypothetical protein